GWNASSIAPRLLGARRAWLCEVIEDRAIGSLVAMAMLREPAKRFHYGPHFAYPALQIGDVCFSEALHFARGTLLVAPEREQGGDFIEREAQIAGAANELKHSHVL